MRRKYWYAAALALVLGCVAAYLVIRYGARHCTAMKAANLAKEIKDRTPIDCAEFWVNRYQTLAAAAFAVVAAYFSIRATREQTAAAQRTNENVARVAIYDALRSYSEEAFNHIQLIEAFDEETLAIFNRSPPEANLSEQKIQVAHLPTELAKRIFRFERQSVGLASNCATLNTQNAPIVHLFARSRLASLIIECEEIVKELGRPIGIYDPFFGPELWKGILAASTECPAGLEGRQVAAWLDEQASRRRQKMAASEIHSAASK